MATKNRIAHALPIIQIMYILSAKPNKQMRLRLIYRERMGVMSRYAEFAHLRESIGISGDRRDNSVIR